jgi:SAM-dependent methyltransferase
MPGRPPSAYLWNQTEIHLGLASARPGRSLEEPMAIDQDKLTEFLNKFVGDLGATMAAGNVLVGDAASLVASWLPALDGVEAKLTAGAKVADIGCGHGASTTLMARAFPNSAFTGSDYHEESIIQARKRIADAGLSGQVTFEVASAQTFDGGPYDLVTSFDCLHDMGDPLGAARHIREMLAPDATWMVVEPYAGNSVTDNLNPVGRVYYSFSTFLCVPNALSQDGGYSLGAQAGEEPIRRLAADAGFTGFRRTAETPFNIVYEVRP